MRLFDFFVGIDWSGNKKAWQKGIKIGVAVTGSDPPRIEVGPGPKGSWSRSEVAKWLDDFVCDKRALIGIDFAFGFPPIQEFAKDVVGDWTYVETLCAADQNFYGGQFFRSAVAPHSCLVNSPWLPRIDYSAHRLRTTELLAKRTKGATPQSIFNARGAAQVGPSSTSGMRMLLRMKRERSDIVSIWPFDDISDTRSVIVEIFPRYFPLSRGLSPKLADHAVLTAALAAFGSLPALTAPASEDEGDALLTAAALRALSTDDTFFKLPDASIRQEGWIFGVPLGGKS